jgi:hypothetical protein
MDEFRIDINQIDFAIMQYVIFDTRQNRSDHLLRGVDDGKSQQASLPEILMADLGTAGRETISAAGQDFLYHTALLLEVLWCMQAQINLQDANYHCESISRLKGSFLFLDLVYLDDITRLYIVVILEPDTALVVRADFLDVIFETAQRRQLAGPDHDIVA